MKIEVHNRVSDFNSYRAARVKSIFNAENGCNFDLELDAELPDEWQIGVVVGPSGSGKTSIGKVIFGENLICDYTQGWAPDKPIIDEIAPGGDFNEVTGALTNVGLGNVPAWLRPFRVLSNGEQFRAGLARIICEKPERVVIDEFTSVVDRQIAKVGSQAFAKSWRKANPKGKVVLLTPHYDILDWVQPDWVIDTKTCTFERGCRSRRRMECKIFSTDWRYWEVFRQHHYLKFGPMPAGRVYVGVIDGELAVHLGVAPAFQSKAYRLARFVVMPEWQGAGLGKAFINWVAQWHLDGKGVAGRKYGCIIQTSHPRLIQSFKRDGRWQMRSATLYGTNRAQNISSFGASGKRLKNRNLKHGAGGFGGHFRGTAGFRSIGMRE